MDYAKGAGANTATAGVNYRRLMGTRAAALVAGRNLVGIQAWTSTGGAARTETFICVEFDTEADQTYTITVDGRRNKWKVSLARQAEGKSIAIHPVSVTYFDKTLPCEWLRADRRRASGFPP